MNPQSAYYLSFNTGYPNAYDRSLGHTGSELMVHGDCSSRGCYAMTDEQIAEIYSLGREVFFGGQKSFQFQAYPFQMTPINMAKHRNNPNMPFWRMIKEGYDHFEVTRQEPKVDFCEKKYVFDAVEVAECQAESGVLRLRQVPGLCRSGRRRRRRAREAGAGAGRDRQADCAGNAGRPDQYRHRRRHEQDVRLQAARRQYRPVGRPATVPDCRSRLPVRPAPFRRRSIRRAERRTSRWWPQHRARACAAPATRVASAAPTAPAPQSDGFFAASPARSDLAAARMPRERATGSAARRKAEAQRAHAASGSRDPEDFAERPTQRPPKRSRPPSSRRR